MNFFIGKRFSFLESVGIGYASIMINEGNWVTGIVGLIIFVGVSLALEIKFGR